MNLVTTLPSQGLIIFCDVLDILSRNGILLCLWQNVRTAVGEDNVYAADLLDESGINEKPPSDLDKLVTEQLCGI